MLALLGLNSHLKCLHLALALVQHRFKAPLVLSELLLFLELSIALRVQTDETLEVDHHLDHVGQVNPLYALVTQVLIEILQEFQHL